MINIYLDPSSYSFLSNNLLNKIGDNNEDRLLFFRYLKKYCSERDINLNTIDFWDKNKASKEDIYVSIDHKSFIKKFYWRFKNKNYPIINLNNFKKRILFHGEPPTITPDVYQNINRLFKIYDKIYFACKVGNPKCYYFQTPRPYNSVLSNYWENSNRKFLVMININKKLGHRRLRIILVKPLQRELLSERIKVIEFFSRTNEIDLYGWDWDKSPSFFIQKVYKGKVESKYQKLSEYKFAIAFENNITPGFIGEALFDCFYVGTVPIYLGAPDIEEYIPKECFIDMRKFKDYKALRVFLKSLTESEIEAYRQNARKFLESEKFKPFTKEYFAERFVNIIKE